MIYLAGAILIIFFGFVIESGYTRIFFDKDDRLFKDHLFGTSFLFTLGCSLFFGLLISVFSFQVSGLIFNFQDGDYYLKLIVVFTFLKAMAEIPLKSLIVKKKARRFVLNNLLYVIVSLSSSIYFIVILKLNIAGVLYGQILAAIVQLITLLKTEFKKSCLHFSISYFKEMFYFSIFFIPTRLSAFVTYWSNRYFLQQYTNLEDVGTFSLGYKIASIIPLLLTGPLKKAIGPEVYAFIQKPDQCRLKIKHFSMLVLILLTSFSLSISLFSKELIKIIAPQSYMSSFEVVFLLSMGYVLIGLAGVVVLPIHIAKKPWLITISWILSSILNIILNYFLVRSHGKAGATYASLLTFLFILVVYFVFSELVYKVRFDYFKYGIILIIAFISYMGSLNVRTNILIVNIIIKFLILLISIIAFLKIGLSRAEINKYRMTVRKFLTGKFLHKH
jgi:O-antigen/teichoic acid export membrane protein